MTTNINRAAEVISLALADDADVSIDGNYNNIMDFSEATLDGKYDLTAVARALADAGLLRPDPSSRYDGQYRTSFHRDEDAGNGPYIEAYLSTHHPAPEWKIVHQADVSIDIGGEHGYHNLHAFATAEWCREAAAVLLDVADEVDRKNKETTEEVGTDE